MSEAKCHRSRELALAGLLIMAVSSWLCLTVIAQAKESAVLRTKLESMADDVSRIRTVIEKSVGDKK